MAETGTRTILIREVEEQELRVYKASAALSGMSLQAWCLQILRDHVQAQTQSGTAVTLTAVPAQATPPIEGEHKTGTVITAPTT
jgi:hypothetical protein